MFVVLSRNVVIAFLLSHLCSADTVSILMNIGYEDKARTQSHALATAKDFQVADPKVDKLAPVHNLTHEKAVMWYTLDLFTAQDSEGKTHDIDLEGGPHSAYSALSPTWTHNLPISDSYLFTKSSDPATLTVHGIKDAGGLITLTVWAIGDNIGQHATIVPTYGKTTLKGKSTSFGTNRETPTDATPYVQFTFPADGETDSISFQWSNPKASRKSEQFSCLNGFSITYSKK